MMKSISTLKSRNKTKMELKIIVKEQLYHPHLDVDPRTKITEFKMENGTAAETYYNKVREITENSGGLAAVSISIVHKNETT